MAKALFNLCIILGRIISLSWHPSGTKVAAGMMDMIKIFDVESGKLTVAFFMAMQLFNRKKSGNECFCHP